MSRKVLNVFDFADASEVKKGCRFDFEARTGIFFLPYQASKIKSLQ
jgi:hypothetical protein